MTPSFDHRRQLLAGLAGAAVWAVFGDPARAAVDARAVAACRALADLERRHGGRLGVQVLDPAAPTRPIAHRGDERFALCSTFKLPLAAMILSEIEAGRLAADTPVRFAADDVLAHSPVLERHVDAGALPVLALAEAAQVQGDNGAANLLLSQVGGPDGFTRWLRTIGDEVTRLDRCETGLNHVQPGALHDTTTPRAIAGTVARLFAGDLLGRASRAQLQRWMIATRTGLARLRAGFPADWQAGDKTGSALAAGMPNRHNDIAVVWRPSAPPLVVAAYYESDRPYPSLRAEHDALLAAVGRIAADACAEAV